MPTSAAAMFLKRRMRARIHSCLAGLLGLWSCMPPAWADSSVEYRLKVAFVYNFISFTRWPAGVGSPLNLCVYGPDPFGESLDKLQGRGVADYTLAVRRISSVDALAGCQVVFISRSAIGNLPHVLDSLKGRPVLTMADTPGAVHQGVAINMTTEQDTIHFEANAAAARNSGLVLSSKLLRLATEVYQ